MPRDIDIVEVGGAAIATGAGVTTSGTPRIVPASDASFTIAAASGTAAHTSVAAAASDTLLLAANASRKYAFIYNDSTSVLYLKLGTGATSASKWLDLQPYEGYPIPSEYLGVVHGCWASATGNARVTEIA